MSEMNSISKGKDFKVNLWITEKQTRFLISVFVEIFDKMLYALFKEFTQWPLFPMETVRSEGCGLSTVPECEKDM